MAKLKITGLPQEMLQNIFSFLNVATLRDVALVCQHLYEAVCELEKDKIVIEISSDDISDDAIYNSIISSKRKVNDLTYLIKGFRWERDETRLLPAMVRITEQFASLLKIFSINYERALFPIPGGQLYTILNCMPNLEELKLANLKVNPEKNAREELHLPKLKKLSLSRCEFSTELLKWFPSNILLDLSLDYNKHTGIKRCIQDFLDRQSNITKLHTAFDTFGIARSRRVKLNLDHLKLEELEVRGLGNKLEEILIHQPHIRSLFVDYSVREIGEGYDENRFIELFNAMLTLVKLVRLRIILYGRKETEYTIRAIGNLTSLKTLLVKDPLSCASNVMKWSDAQLPLLERLELDHKRPENSSEEVARLGISFPSLKYLMVWSSWLPQLVNVLDTFPDLETFVMREQRSYLIECAHQVVVRDGFSHTNLKQLVVGNSIEHVIVNNMPQLLRIVNACRKLERLMIYYSSSIDTEDLRDILECTQI